MSPPTSGSRRTTPSTGRSSPARVLRTSSSGSRTPWLYDFEDSSVDRVVATCLLIHLPGPYGAMHEWQRACQPDGVIDVLVPCDPGHRLAVAFRRGVSQRVARKHGRAGRGVRSGQRHRAPQPLQPRPASWSGRQSTPGRRLEVDYFPFAKVPSWNLNAFAIMRIDPDVRGRARRPTPVRDSRACRRRPPPRARTRRTHAPVTTDESSRSAVHLLLPCFNEEQSVQPMVETLARVFADEPAWDVTAVFIDDGSHDATWTRSPASETMDLPHHRRRHPARAQPGQGSRPGDRDPARSRPRTASWC